MSKNDVYHVEILNWEKHNPSPKRKKGFTHFLFHSGFFSDSKINQLNQNEMILFIKLMCIASETNANSCQIHVKSLPRSLRIGDKMMLKSLNQLQSIQLVTFTKIDSLRIEENKKEKRREEKRTCNEVESRPSSPVINFPTNRDANRKVWGAYRDAFLARYKVEPKRNAKVNTAIVGLVNRLGEEDAIEVVKFYMFHNDGFYLKQSHAIGLCLKDCESLHTQRLRGRAITNREIKKFEDNQQRLEIYQAIEDGTI